MYRCIVGTLDKICSFNISTIKLQLQSRNIQLELGLMSFVLILQRVYFQRLEW